MATLRELLLSMCVYILISSSTNYVYSSSCFSSLLSFGDSVTDTGNKLRLALSSTPVILPHYGRPPYGVTYFHYPTGRCSDGRVIIDFIAEYLGFPYVEPYFTHQDYRNSVNFAMVGATALSAEFFLEKGIDNPFTNGSLDIQLSFCKTMLATLFPKNSNEFLKNSLIFMEIGGNDYNYALLTSGSNIREVETFMRPVVDKIGSAIIELIELGATSFLVTGCHPLGCSAAYLAEFQNSSSKEDFDPSTGCINFLNEFAQKHNRILSTELSRIQQLYPHTTITYADFYNAAMPIFRSPEQYGFTTSTVACCGGGGINNYNPSLLCGDPPVSSGCDNPSTRANWDGVHLTEAANRIVTTNLIEGLDTITWFKYKCSSKSAS